MQKQTHLPPSTANISSHIQWFRGAAPYINTHRNKVFVIMFSGEAVLHENFQDMIHDFALLKSLGIKLVLVHGARKQIDENLALQNIETPIEHELRVTTRESLTSVLNAVGSTRLKIEAQLTRGLVNSPMYGARIDVVAGNYVIAKPYGVRKGVDYQLTGAVRSIDTDAINSNLANNQVVLLGSIGYSTTGEVFNLLAEQVAVKTAIALHADKLIFMGVDGVNASVTPHKEFLPTDVFTLLDTYKAKQTLIPTEFRRHLTGAAKACNQGVTRAHIISYMHSDHLLKELFTREGSGTLVSANAYENIQPATIDDVGGLIELLTPLENKGILVRRSREKLEAEINHFIVTKIDGLIVGCAALYPIEFNANDVPTKAEIACVAVKENYRNNKRGEKLLAFLEAQAKKMNIHTIFVLTTQTAHWFIEQGFSQTTLAELPEQKQRLYNHQRNSKVFSKAI